MSDNRKASGSLQSCPDKFTPEGRVVSLRHVFMASHITDVCYDSGAQPYVDRAAAGGDVDIL